MLRRIALGLGAASLAISMSATVVAAGQPSVSCDDGTLTPGFTHFSVGEAHYANPDATGGVQSGNGHVVSQYDIACFRPASN
jgi:hypothetical protein